MAKLVWEDIKKLNYKKHKKFFIQLILAIIFSLLATQTTYLASIYIHNTFGKPEVVRDLLWEKLPYIPTAISFSEVFLVLSMIIFGVYSFRKNINLIPYAIFLISCFHFLRAGLIILTPLGFPQAYSGFMKSGTESVFLFGAFPSGHLSIPYLLLMISHKKIFYLFTFLVGFFLLISHAHYSIDLIGTLLVGYPLFKFSEKYLGRWFKDEK